MPGTVASLSLWRDLTAVWARRRVVARRRRPETRRTRHRLQEVLRRSRFPKRHPHRADERLAHRGGVAESFEIRTLKPDLKLPAGALIVGLKADDNGFADRLKIAFQSVVALANVNALQTQGTPLELGSEKLGDVTISTSHFLPPKKGNASADLRYNFTPSVVKVEITLSSVPASASRGLW